MKKIFIFLSLVCVIATYGQTPIPNGGFENWNSTNYEYPQYYQYTSNPNAFASGLPFNVVRTADKQNGDSAIMITSYGNDNGPGYFANIDPENSGEDISSWHGGMVITETPTGIQGYYKYNIESPDSAVIIFVFTHAGENCGTYFFKLGGNKTEYTYFNFPFPEFTIAPDSVVFAVASSDISNQDLEIISGTTLILDNVSFTGVTSQPEHMNGDFESWKTGQTPYFLDNWYTNNNTDGVSRSTDKHDGNYALELTTTQGGSDDDPEARQAEATNGYWNEACHCQMGGIPFSNQIDTLAFWYKYAPSGSDSAEICLNFKKNGSDIGGQNLRLHAAADYQYIEFPFNFNWGGTPDTVIIRITSSSQGDGTGKGGNNISLSCVGSTLTIDSLRFKSATPPPTSVTSSAVTQTSATISWNAPSPAPSNGYQYEIRTSGEAGSGASGLATSGTTAAGDVNADISGLTKATTYSVYVRGNFGGAGFSSWSNAYNFSTLCDAITSFPWTENLSSANPPSLPSCWSQNNANSDWRQWQTNPFMENYAFNIHTSGSGGNNNDYLILPQITLTNNQELLFSVATENSSSPNNFRVVLSESGNAPSDFDHEIMDTTIVSSNTMTQITTPIDLSAYSGDVWIAIHIPTSTLEGQGLFVDDFIIEDIPACPKPTAVTTSAVDYTTATISWTAPTPAPSSGYQYEIRTSGNAGSGTPGLVKSGNTAAGVVSKDITDLTASTNYYVYVRAICNAPDTSEWTSAYSFTTLCNKISSFPWTEDLNSINPPSWPPCWSSNNANSDGYQWQTNNFGGPVFNMFTGGNGGNNNDYLILPQISLTGGNKQLSFKVASANPGSPNSFRVVLSEGGNAPSDFTYEIMPTTVASNNSLTEITPINLSDHSGHDVWIAIHVPNTGTECQGLFADDFIIEDIPSCSKPTALTISAVSQTSATISWTAPTPAPANGYQYEIRAYGEAGSGINGLTVLGTTAAGDVDDNFIGLSASSNYNAYVRAICGSEDTSAWTNANNFSTPCDITIAPFTESFESGNVPPSCWSATYPGVFWSNTGYSSYGSGNVSALARFYTFSNTNPFDLISNTFDISGMSTPTLTFDYAYATRSGQTDQLDVYYSTNGGVNFIPLLNMPGGTAGILNTAGTIVSEFFPSSSQWKTQVISLPAGTNKLKFTATSANGNNLFIDNIKVSDLIIWTGETSTAWSNINNWNPKAIPTSTNDVIIPSGTANEPYVDISTPAACKNLTINPGSTLTIDAGKYLTASGTTTNNGTFTIKSTSLASTGSFIDNGIAGIGNYNVEKYLEETNYYYVGIPISGIRSTVFDILGGNKLWSHSETTGLYSSVLDNVTLNVKQGYVTKLLIPKTVSFSGTSINTGTQTNNLTLTSPASAFEGYNLICNPYPSAVDIESATTDASNLETTIWYRSGGNFYTYNWTGHSGTGSRYVPAMQAFWTKVAAGNSNGTLIFENADRLHNSQAFYKATSQPNVLRMQVSNGTLNDEVLLGFYQNASDNFENYDSRKMFGDDEYPQLYSLTSDNIKVAINGYPELSANNEKVVPLGFKTSTSGSFTINAINLGEFDVSIPVYLEDAQQSIIQDLRQTNTYAFTSPVIDDANRFKLHFGNTITSVPANSESAISVYATNKTIYINTPKNANVKVYDVLGNLILNQQAVQGLNKFQLNVETGIYITKVQTEGQIITQKVMLNK
ncbi:MAG TPA: choice-of-anchor J domain-containing protein [Bacteroidales bacterium]|nr:choice-of-anchor J domain-containing protein [Bacteroidales bacterium]HPS18020.1 choice-of-anchor J domain-containing protein [Bacteroidales bacterium]